MTILLVENDDHVREVTAIILRSAGFEVVPVANGEQALQVLQGNRAIRLVLTDVMMPVMDGLTLIDTIRAAPALAHLPIVIMTGAPLPIRTPPDVTLLSKPFRMHTLLDAVQGRLGDEPGPVPSEVVRRPSSRPSAPLVPALSNAG